MKKKINLVAEIENDDLTLEITYPKGTDPEVATTVTEELTELFEKYAELLKD